MDYKMELVKAMETAISQNLNHYRSDRTYKSVVKRATPKGYVILDHAGSERTVRCCIPGVTLNAGQSVWVKEPMGDLKDLHICGVVNKSK